LFTDADLKKARNYQQVAGKRGVKKSLNLAIGLSIAGGSNLANPAERVDKVVF
jgi:hypothetical protein